jgi:hypothetical protein
MRILISAIAAGAMAMAATAASATEVTETATFAAGPKKVWKAAAADFCGIGKFHPAIEKCELADGGMTRTLSLKGGGTIVEKRTAWDKKAMSYSYEIVESPLPVANYKSTFTVAKAGKKQSTVTWTSTFEPKGASEDEAKKTISGIYTAGFDGLKSKL